MIEYNDQIIWTASEDGEFIISSALEILNVQQQPPTWCNTLWFKGKVPKHSIYLWMAVNKGLKTKDILLNKTQIADPSYNSPLAPPVRFSITLWAYMDQFFLKPESGP